MKASEAKVASVIDIGSNTIKFLVAARGMKVLDQGSEDTRIGVGMGKAGPIVLQQAAMNAAAECVEMLYKRAIPYEPDVQTIVATSAVRDAENRDEFLQMVRSRTGLSLRILSGDEEAQYVGAGVARDPNIASHKPFYLMDLGGGSLELLEYSGGMVRQKRSLPLGAVRLNEKLLEDSTRALSESEIDEVSEYVTEQVMMSGFDFRAPGALVGTGGGLTHARFLIGAEDGMSRADSSATIHISKMRKLTRKIAAMSLEERLHYSGLPKARADIMPVALIVLTTVMELAMAGSVVHSFYNLRYGMAAELLGD